MRPTIYIDFKNPASYLALHPTCAVLERLGMKARWLPFHTSEETLPERKPGETRGEAHRRVRAGARRRTHLLYADIQGIEMQFRDDPGSTVTSLAALACFDKEVDEDPLPFIRAAFEGYWVRGEDLDDAATVAALWNESTARRPLNLEQGREALAQIRDAAIEQKVFHAPTYLVGDQVFIGREHLPWMESLLREAAQE